MASGLGHPSDSILNLLSAISKSKIVIPCDICFHAKQTREPFPNSLKKATSIFSLIHCEVWSLYKVKTYFGGKYFLTILDNCSRATWIFFYG